MLPPVKKSICCCLSHQNPATCLFRTVLASVQISLLIQTRTLFHLRKRYGQILAHRPLVSFTVNTIPECTGTSPVQNIRSVVSQQFHWCHVLPDVPHSFIWPAVVNWMTSTRIIHAMEDFSRLIVFSECWRRVLFSDSVLGLMMEGHDWEGMEGQHKCSWLTDC